MNKKLPEPKPEFVKRMKDLLGKDAKNYFEILKSQPVKSIRCNLIKISPKDLKKRLEDNGWIITQPYKNHPDVMVVEGKKTISEKIAKPTSQKVGDRFRESISRVAGGDLVDKNSSDPVRGDAGPQGSQKLGRRRGEILDLAPGELGRALEHLLGYYYIQELASMLPVIALDPKPEEIILDLCAAPGSKTTQLASYMNNSGNIIANEMSLGRIKILASNLERCGVANTIITRKEGSAACKRFKKGNIKFDKILIDAPCSGEGTLRSTTKTYLMWNLNTVKALSGMQKKLVSEAIEILKPGGTLVYSTCTHAPEENEAVVDFVLKNFPQMKIKKITLPIKPRPGILSWQEEKYAEEAKHACRIYPHDNNTEGFFIAKFVKAK